MPGTSGILQSSDINLWVTCVAPEPQDFYRPNICIPHGKLWARHLATFLGCVAFMVLFMVPIVFIQGIAQLSELQQRFPFLKGIFTKRYVSMIVTDHLPGLILIIFLYVVPPTMLQLVAIQGSISRSGRKRSTCYMVLYFTIWNAFFVNVLSSTLISNMDTLFSRKALPALFTRAIPIQATFFISYVLTSGWVSLSAETMRMFALTGKYFKRYVSRSEENSSSASSFPYYMNIPGLLLFGLIGFTYAILAPLILPFLLVYFILCYVVYRHQILEFYVPKYDTNGEVWPFVHNMTIFSLVMAQIIALVVFMSKSCHFASGLVLPLLVGTLIFNDFCRQHFQPLFKYSAQDFIEMDDEDERYGRMDGIHQLLQTGQPTCILTDNFRTRPGT